MDTAPTTGTTTYELSDEQRKRQQAILKSGDTWDAYDFARYVKGADIPALQKVVLDSCNASDIYRFARDIDGADMHSTRSRLAALALMDNDKGRLAQFDTNPDMQNKLRAQRNAAYPDIGYRKSGDGSNVVHESPDTYVTTAQLKSIMDIDMQTYQKSVIERGDALNAYGLARYLNGADIEGLQKVVLANGSGSDLYRFAKNVSGADMLSIRERLVALHDMDADKGRLELFDNDPDIQAKLKEQLSALKSVRPKNI